MLELVNSEIRDVIIMGHILGEKYKDVRGIQLLRRCVENYVDGHLLWYAGCARYGDIKFEYLPYHSTDLPFNVERPQSIDKRLVSNPEDFTD